MKKFYVIAAAALVSLASCTKSEVVNPNSNKAIAFTAVAGKATKAPIEGTIYSLEDPSFGMFAYWQEEGTAYGSSSAKKFMDDVAIQANKTKKIWEPASTYYWPISGTISFVGYSPKVDNEVVASYDNPTKTLTIAGFDASNDHDLLWAEAAVDKSFNDAAYVYATDTQSSELGVPVRFHHALSQVQFWVKSDVDIFTVDNITLKNVKNGKTLEVTDNAAAWTGTGFDANFVVGSNAQTVTNAYVKYGKSLLLTPQDLEDVVISFKYIQSANGINSTSTKEFTAVAQDVFDKWEMNKKYIYYIDLTANRVQFSPSIVDWDATVNESYIWLTAPKTGVINATTTLAVAQPGATVACDGTIVTAAAISDDGKTVTYTVAPNTTGAKREGLIKVSKDKVISIKVVQD